MTKVVMIGFDISFYESINIFRPSILHQRSM